MTMVVVGFDDARTKSVRHVVHALERRHNVGPPVHKRHARPYARQHKP